MAQRIAESFLCVVSLTDGFEQEHVVTLAEQDRRFYPAGFGRADGLDDWHGQRAYARASSIYTTAL